MVQLQMCIVKSAILLLSISLLIGGSLFILVFSKLYYFYKNCMPLQTKQNLQQLLQENKSSFQKFGVEKLGLFGSFVREQQTPESDIDFMVVFSPGKKNFENYMNLSFFLEELCDRKIELLTPESVSPHLGPHIFQELEYVL